MTCHAVSNIRRELPQYQDGAYEDPRTTLVYDDCKKYLEEYEGTFDVIVLDLADPVEAGPAFPIWTKEYYTTCAEKLSPDGAGHTVISRSLSCLPARSVHDNKHVPVVLRSLSPCTGGWMQAFWSHRQDRCRSTKCTRFAHP